MAALGSLAEPRRAFVTGGVPDASGADVPQGEPPDPRAGVSARMRAA